MKLTRNTEYVLIAVLIAYIAFFPRMQGVVQLLSTPVGKALALAGIVYVWKCVSAIAALLLVVAYVRCTSGVYVWEGMSNPAKCVCPDGFNYSAATGQCKNPAGDTKDAISCTCDSGFSYDFVTKECKQNSVMSAPLPPPEAPPAAPPTPMTTAEKAAPASTPSMGPTSTAPATTPGAALEALATAVSTPAAPTSAAPASSEKFTLAGYPLY